MDEKIKSEVRRAKRERQLGENPICTFCGYSKPYGLTVLTRSVFERHHPVGWQNDWGLTITVCRNCHWEQTETIRDEGIPISRCRTFPERLVAMLKLFRVLFLSLARTFGRLAQEVAANFKVRVSDGKQPA
jgi:hypothetical protein